MEQATILPAFWWVCDSCGSDNFERAVVLDSESLEEERADIHDAMQEALQNIVGDSEDMTSNVDVMTLPDVVHCKHCGSEYAAVFYGVGG